MLSRPDLIQFLWEQAYLTAWCGVLAHYDRLNGEMLPLILRVVATQWWGRVVSTVTNHHETPDLATLRRLARRPYLPLTEPIPPPTSDLWRDLYLAPDALRAAEQRLDALIGRLLMVGEKRRRY